MTAFRIVAYLIGLSQLVLGALYLAAPAGFVAWQGLSPIAADTGYPLAMLSARFLVYGIGMFVIARDPARNAFWLFGMVAIQLIDLAAGIGYVAAGAVRLADAALPMVNATVFAGLLGGLGGAALRVAEPAHPSRRGALGAGSGSGQPT